MLHDTLLPAGRTLACGLLVLLVPLTACRAPVRTTELPREVTTSGLSYTDLRVGEGLEVAEGARVTVHYTGRYSDGTVFDSSYDRGEPLSFTVGAGEVIRGWEEGMLGMRGGGHRRISVPPELGFPASSPLAGRVLELEVELLEVEPARVSSCAWPRGTRTG